MNRLCPPLTFRRVRIAEGMHLNGQTARSQSFPLGGVWVRQGFINELGGVLALLSRHVPALGNGPMQHSKFTASFHNGSPAPWHGGDNELTLLVGTGPDSVAS